MKPVMQTDFGQFGNCFSACLASLFELPIEEVPNFFTVTGPYDDAAWWAAVRDWLRPRGYGIMFNDLRDPEHLKLFEGFFIVSGKSSRNVDHATIWKEGVMVHDPHPDQCGLIAPDGVDLIYPLDVAALAALSERGGEAVAYRYRMHPNFHWTLSYRFPVVPNNVEVQPLYTCPQAGQVSENAAQELADRLEQLRAECERLTSTLQSEIVARSEAATRAITAETECERLRRDAERYQWLRKQMVWSNAAISPEKKLVKWVFWVPMEEPNIQGDLTDETVPAQLDTAIDAASAEGER